jgi:hypothetical protein
MALAQAHVAAVVTGKLPTTASEAGVLGHQLQQMKNRSGNV